jgi:acetyltransferase
MDLGKIFNPESIAVVGASDKEGKVGNVIAKNLLSLGYQGRVFLVNPKHDEILGKKCYQRLSDIEEKVDLAVVAIPAKFVASEIKENVDKIKNYVIISAGFSEIKGEGRIREAKLAIIAREFDLNILGPNCLGFIVPRLSLNASFAGGMPDSGEISFITQSGALAVAIMDKAKKENLKFSNIVSIGNKMSIDEIQLLEFLEKDDDTKVIGMYLEGIKEGEKFIRVASRVAREKPIVILKAGKNEKTQKAIASHTGALAGSDEIISAAMRKAGVFRAGNLEEFFGIINLLNSFKSISGKNSVVITNAGGAGVLTADAFNLKNIQLAQMSPEIKKELGRILPTEASIENPIDLLGDAKEDRYRLTLEAVSKSDEIDSVICVLTPQDQTPVDKIADAVCDFKNKTKKVVVAVFIGGEKIESAIEKFKENGVPHFNFPNLAVSAIDGLYQWSNFKNSRIKLTEQLINSGRKEKAEKIIQRALKEKRQALYFSEAKKMMDIYGINTIEAIEIESEKNIKDLNYDKIKYPVVLKIDSEQVLHKTDKKAVTLDIKDQKQLEAEISHMRIIFPGNRLIIQPMVKTGVEIIIGVKIDPSFGPVVIAGLGGIYTEVFKVVDYFLLPQNIAQVEEILKNGKLKFLFSGERGQKYNLEELAKIILEISFMALEVNGIKEFDINPLFIYAGKKDAVAVDVKIII